MSSTPIEAFPGCEPAQPIRRNPNTPMRSELVDQAAKIVPENTVLINMVSQRVKMLNQGRASLVPPKPGYGFADIALLEIIEGKIVLDNGDIVESDS